MQMEVSRGKKLFAGALLLWLALILAGCPAPSGPVQPQASAAENPATAEAEVQEIPVEITVDAVNFPQEVPAGIVSFVFENKGGPEGVPMIARLNDDVTVEQFAAAMQEDFIAGLALASLIGWSDPGVDVVYDLLPGNYVAMLEQEAGPPVIGTFTTAGESRAAAPTADVEVELADFAFIAPDQISAGEQVWQIKNAGQQWHEMIVVELGEGQTIEALMALLAESTDGPPPIEPAAGWYPMGAGRTAWVTLDLPAGEYAVICSLPDIQGDMAPHAMHGMVRMLTVTE